MYYHYLCFPTVIDIFRDVCCYEKPVVHSNNVIVNKTVHVHKHYNSRRRKRHNKYRYKVVYI